jgi:hypothetical protein
MASYHIAGHQFKGRQGSQRVLDAPGRLIKVTGEHPGMRLTTPLVIGSQDEHQQDHLDIALQLHIVRVGHPGSWNTSAFGHTPLSFSEQSKNKNL